MISIIKNTGSLRRKSKDHDVSILFGFKSLKSIQATPLCLALRSSIIGQANRSLECPSLFDRLNSINFLRKFDEKENQVKTLESTDQEEGWRSFGKQCLWFNSKWEANYARYLEMLTVCDVFVKWFYKPCAFSIKSKRDEYSPTFKIFRKDGSHFWVEIGDTKTDSNLWKKTLYFKMEYPEETLIFPDRDWFKDNIEMLKGFIPNWED